MEHRLEFHASRHFSTAMQSRSQSAVLPCFAHYKTGAYILFPPKFRGGLIFRVGLIFCTAYLRQMQQQTDAGAKEEEEVKEKKKEKKKLEEEEEEAY